MDTLPRQKAKRHKFQYFLNVLQYKSDLGSLVITRGWEKDLFMKDLSSVGVEAIAAQIPGFYLESETLAAAQGVDPAKYHNGLGVRRIALPGPQEDPVTLAAGACHRLLSCNDIPASDIGLLVVGTESGVDAAKPIASFVQGLLGLSNHCRTLDVKHACYAGTAAMRMAIQWCATRTGHGPSRAIVVATDVARYALGSPGEPTQGAGAVAMLVGEDARLLALDPYPESVHSEDTMDFWRPQNQKNALVDGRESVVNYLQAMEHTWTGYCETSGLTWDDFDNLLFHIPYPAMAYKALRSLYKSYVASAGDSEAGLAHAIAQRVEPSLWANRMVGNAYSASLYLSLAGLLERGDQAVTGRRIGLFSYGSGLCSEFFSGRIGPDAAAWRGRIGIEDQIKAQIEVDHATYLALRQDDEQQNILPALPPAPIPMFRFLGVQDHKRLYTTGMIANKASARVM